MELETFPVIKQLHTKGKEFIFAVDGVKTLGGVLGSPEFIKAKIDAAFEEILGRHDKVRLLIEHVQSREFLMTQKHEVTLNLFQWIKFTLPSQAQYLLSITNPNYTKHWARRLDNSIAKLVVNLLRTENLPAPFHKELLRFCHQNPVLGNTDTTIGFAHERIFLTITGLGVVSSARAAVPAYLGAVASCAPFVHTLVTDLFPGSNPYTLLDADRHYHELQESVLTVDCKRKMDAINVYNIEQHQVKIQHEMAVILKIQYLETLKERVLESDLLLPREKAAFTSCSHQYAHSWMYVNPKGDARPLDDQTVRDNLTLAIGGEPQMPEICPKCKTSLFDKSAFKHALSCAMGIRATVGAKMERGVHDAVAPIFGRGRTHTFYRDELDWVAKSEEPVLIYGDLKFDKLIVDVGFTTRLNESKCNVGMLSINANQFIEKSKNKAIREDYDIPPNGYAAWGFEANGAWGGQAKSTIKGRFDVLSSENAIDKRTFYWTTQKIGKTIRMCNSMYLNFARSGGVKTVA
jgi:hypothetical protein